jgi:hypothetical protein
MPQTTSALPALLSLVDTFDWARIAQSLDAHGNAVLPGLLTAAQCDALAALYPRPDGFRSRVVMARHGFGRGEYKYFAYPLPPLLDHLRHALYPRLVPMANRWHQQLGAPGAAGLGARAHAHAHAHAHTEPTQQHTPPHTPQQAQAHAPRYPADLATFLQQCHAAGQTRPTPLILRYGAGDYNCLHQDLYGEHVFPLQVAVLLSEPGRDFVGGEFVMTERSSQGQRADVVALRQGDAVVFAVHERPVPGQRGMRKVAMRHGVSRIRSGQRHTVGLIFHDAS